MQGEYDMSEYTKEEISEFVSDLSIPIDARIGETRISVKKLCNMKAGDIYILKKLVGEPIDLYVGNLHIAECDAVEIDENFGIRVAKMNELLEIYRQTKRKKEGEGENG